MPGEGALLGSVLQNGMAFVFGLSGWQAARDLPAFRAAIAAYRLVPQSCITAVAFGLVTADCASFGALLYPATARPASCSAAALLLLYAAAMQINLRRGRTDIDCGCGGTTGQKISGALVARNVVLALLLIVTCFCPPNDPLDAFTLIVACFGTASIAGLYFAASQIIANQAHVRVLRA